MTSLGKQILAIMILLVIVAAFGCAGCTRVGVGHVGIEVDLSGSQRGVQDFTIKTGWVAYNPLSTQIVEYPTYVQTAVWSSNPNEGGPQNDEISFTNKDSMVIRLDVNMSYSLDPQKIPAFYVKFRSDDLNQFTHGYLKNAVRNCFNDTAGLYAIADIMGDNSKFLKQARDCVQEDVKEIGVRIEQMGIIGAPRPPQAVIDSINAKIQATQLALQKQNELVQAQAEANKTVAYAEGQAKAAIAVAEGQAKANRLISESLTDKVLERTRLDLQWHWIDRWDGHRGQTEINTGQGMLFQVPNVVK